MSTAPAKPTWANGCLCEHAYKNLGMLYRVSMGKGWVRTTTNPKCPHHGTGAS